MKGLNRFATIMAAIVFAVVVAGSQLAWSLRTASYLQSVGTKAGTSAAVAATLPEYAAKKLPNPEAAKQVFAQNVTAQSVELSLQSLYSSISAAYVGKADAVELDLAPIVRPVQAAGYQIPPGTVFANESVQVGGLASLLHIAQRALLPSIILLAALLGLVALLGVKRNSMRAVRSVLLITALILGGLYVATLGMPLLVSSLVTSSSLDAAVRDIVLTFVDALIVDMGRYYIAWIIILVVASLGLSVLLGLTHRRKRPAKNKQKAQKLPADPEEL